jgi:hypothetical protein
MAISLYYLPTRPAASMCYVFIECWYMNIYVCIMVFLKKLTPQKYFRKVKLGVSYCAEVAVLLTPHMS